MAVGQWLSSEHFTAKERMPEVRHHFRVSWHPLCSAPAGWECLLQRRRGGTRWKSPSQLPPATFSAPTLCIERDLVEVAIGGSCLEQDLQKNSENKDSLIQSRGSQRGDEKGLQSHKREPQKGPEFAELTSAGHRQELLQALSREGLGKTLGDIFQ